MKLFLLLNRCQHLVLGAAHKAAAFKQDTGFITGNEDRQILSCHGLHKIRTGDLGHLPAIRRTAAAAIRCSR